MNQLQNKIFCGGNLEVVSSWPSNCIDGICTDPPYGLGFMGKEWDTLIEKTRDSAGGFLRDGKSGSNPYAAARCRHGSDSYQMQEWYYHWAEAMLRITKPGGFLLCFGGTRTIHRLACAIEDAGWEVRDKICWLFGSGFPKSHNISKAIDKQKGQYKKGAILPSSRTTGASDTGIATTFQEKTAANPQTELAKLWDGYGTALKPAYEDILVCMKPLDGTFAHNAEAHQVAGLNIDGGRIRITNEVEKQKHGQEWDREWKTDWLKHRHDQEPNYPGWKPRKENGKESQGRWPANLVLTHHPDCWADENTKISCHLDCPVRLLDEQTGIKKSGFMAAGTKRLMSDNPNKNTYGKFNPDTVRNDTYGDSGGASRFFYCAKASRKERNMGMEDCGGKKVNDGRQTPIDNPYQRGETIRLNTHPTVKPLALMKYLCTLLKMPSADQIILDPFLGSGTTGMACKELGINFIGIEKEPEYCEIAVKRIAAVPGQKITLEITLPVTTNVAVPKPKPNISESKQNIINAASAALRRNQK